MCATQYYNTLIYSLFLGPACSEKVDSCVCNNPCSDYGECRESEYGPVCVCDACWTGERCDVRMETCECTNSCQSHEECTNSGNSHTCACPSCYTGPTCSEKINRWDSTPYLCAAWSDFIQ